MRPTVTDRVVWSVCQSVYRSVGRYVTIVRDVSPAKTSEPIEMPFGCELGWAQKTILRWGPAPHEKRQF